ncbi:MAG TPA: response regulator transcription factor [Chloroflexota bacterium]|nr:response regulator transcription factor [Chloroflexota bacterium]
MQILVVDDEPSLVQTIAYALRKEGYEVVTAADGAVGLEIVRQSQPNLIVLDLMLPGVDGLEVCRRIRRVSSVPIIMLTARAEEVDRVIGLEVGADDYLTKPFSVRELVARIRAQLRRYELVREEVTSSGGDLSTPDVLDAGNLHIDVRAHRVTRDDELIPLTPKEFDLLIALVRNRGKVLSAARLLETVWGYTDPDTRTVTVHIRSLRSKIEADPSNPTRIETVRGVGYRYRK